MMAVSATAIWKVGGWADHPIYHSSWGLGYHWLSWEFGNQAKNKIETLDEVAVEAIK